MRQAEIILISIRDELSSISEALRIQNKLAIAKEAYVTGKLSKADYVEILEEANQVS